MRPNIGTRQRTDVTAISEHGNGKLLRQVAAPEIFGELGAHDGFSDMTWRAW